MNQHDAPGSVDPHGDVTRRGFLRAGALSMLGLGLSQGEPASAGGLLARDRDLNCVLLFLTGGPSHLDTWDMKPDAPEEIRGPFRPIATRVPGIQISELFPRLATVMNRVSLVRTLHHDAAAIHDTGHQLMQTGRLFQAGLEHPHIGCVLSHLVGPRGNTPAHVLLPRPIGRTGGGMPHGQNAGFLGRSHDPLVLNADPNAPEFETADPQRVEALASSRATREAFDLGEESEDLRDRYGRTRFGQSCLMARRLIERGCRFVTVNQFETVFGERTWDCHGAPPFSTMADYPAAVAPSFDNAYASLIEDLDRTGLLETTMVLAFGEFGRTPRINAAGGRDHHPGCWTALLAGGPLRGGRVVGESDAIGHSPRDRPVSPAEMVATVYHGVGLSPDITLPNPQGQPIRLVEPGIEPIRELF